MQWPLVEIGVRGDSANGVTLLALPSLAARQRDELREHRMVHASAIVARRWLAVAKYLIDSGAALAQNYRAQPFGVSLSDSGARYSLFLGIDPKRPPATRVLLELDDTAATDNWVAVGGVANARALLATVDSIVSLPGGVREMPPDSPARTCPGAVPAGLPQKQPSLRPPRDAGGGMVVLRFVIDTSGRPVDSTVKVMLSSGPQFTESVHQMFRTVRYRPARCAGKPVPQLVEEQFTMPL